MAKITPRDTIDIKQEPENIVEGTLAGLRFYKNETDTTDEIYCVLGAVSKKGEETDPRDGQNQETHERCRPNNRQATQGSGHREDEKTTTRKGKTERSCVPRDPAG